MQWPWPETVVLTKLTPRRYLRLSPKTKRASMEFELLPTQQDTKNISDWHWNNEQEIDRQTVSHSGNN